MFLMKLDIFNPLIYSTATVRPVKLWNKKSIFVQNFMFFIVVKKYKSTSTKFFQFALKCSLDYLKS